ncbi:MAG: hypothetical protein IIZ37_02600 [Acinetobacter sp.]|nr:hypothetical protein [Acinetobacter sp.]
MAYIGLRYWMIARIDAKTKQVITDTSKGGLTTNCGNPGVFRVDLSSAGGATQANISNLQGTITKTYGSNAVARAAAGTPEPSVALGANGIPFDVIQSVTGMKKNADGSYTRNTDAEINHCALLICSDDWDGNQAYVGFYDGAVTMGNTNIQTNNQSEKITDDSLTFTALGVDSTVGESSVTGSIESVSNGGAIQTVQTGNSVDVYSMWNSGVQGFNYNNMIANIFKQGSNGTSTGVPSGTTSIPTSSTTTTATSNTTSTSEK